MEKKYSLLDLDTAVKIHLNKPFLPTSD